MAQRRAWVVWAMVLIASVPARASAALAPSFGIEDDRFVQDGKPVQLISGRRAREGRAAVAAPPAWRRESPSLAHNSD